MGIGEERSGGPGCGGALAGRREFNADTPVQGEMAALFTAAVEVGDLSDGELRVRLRILRRARARLAALDAEAVAELTRRDGEAPAAGL